MSKKEVKVKEDSSLEEIRKLAEESDRNSGLSLGLEMEFEKELVQLNLIDDNQNPQESYRLYYAIEGILRTHLPPTSVSEFAKYVREEKNIFLTGGKKKDFSGRRGADSRQAYISTHLEIALNELLRWMQESGNKFDLFLLFRTLNIKYGYFMEDEIGKANQNK